MSNTENNDANGKNGDTITPGLGFSKARTHSSGNYGDKAFTPGNGSNDLKLIKQDTDTEHSIIRLESTGRKGAFTRRMARLSAFAKSAVKVVGRNSPHREAHDTHPVAPNADTEAPLPDASQARDELPESRQFRPARDLGDFAKRLREAFPGLKFEAVSSCDSQDRIGQRIFRPRMEDRPGALEEQHERDLAELSTRLDKFKGLMPGCSYMYALQLVEALSDGCYGDPRLAIHVLDEMERIRVASGADGAKHDPRKAALDCMSRLGPWLVFNKPKLHPASKRDADGYRSPQKQFTKMEQEQAFTRTAALLSDTHHTRHGFDALCLATGMMSPRDLRATRDPEDACGSAGAHRLDLLHPDIGKRLVLTRLQALNQDNGDARATHLATRVIAHTSKLACILRNQKLLDSLPSVPKPPKHLRLLSPNTGTDQQARLEMLRARYKAERAALEQQIDMLIYGNEKIGLEGIGEAAFADLCCWFNDMHTDEDVNRVGGMCKEFARDYQICDAIAERPVLEKLGPIRHLVEGSSALYARHKLGRGVAGRRHGDEDHKEGVDTAGEMLRVIASELERITPDAGTHDRSRTILQAIQVCHLLLTAGCGLRSTATGPERLAALRAALQKLPYPVKGVAASHAIACYCEIFAPELKDRPPETIEALCIRQNFSNTELAHHRREQLSQQLDHLIGHRDITPEQRVFLRGRQQKLDIINGNASRGSATIEATCQSRQYDDLYAQDNTEMISDGVSATLSATVELPITPDGQLKISNTNQASAKIAKTIQVNRENNGNQTGIYNEISRGKKTTIGLGYSEKLGMGAANGEVAATAEVSRATEQARLIGCQITVKRHALNYVDEYGKETELARANYEGVGEFGEHRVLSAKLNDFHAGSACNPDDLTPEQLLAQYPEHLRPKVKLSQKDLEIKPFTGKKLNEEERKARLDPLRERKLEEMSGQKYLRRLFTKFRHYDHAIVITENQRNNSSTKYNASLGAKFKAAVSGVGQMEARANAISHTRSRDSNIRRDVKGTELFESVMYSNVHSTYTGITVDTATGKGVISEDETAGRRRGRMRKLGETLESQLIKLVTKEGKTTAFYSYCGKNFTNFDEFKREVDKDPRAWGALLREENLTRLPGETDDALQRRQEAADRVNLEAKLAFLKETKPGQNKRILVRLRMRESTAVKLDQIRCEIHHTEATIRQTIDRLERLKYNGGPAATPEMRAELQAKLTKLEHTLDSLYAEKVKLLTNAANWSPFGLGTGEAASKSDSSSIPVKIATKYLTAGAELASVQKFTEYYETAWLKENARSSDDSHRLGRESDLRAMEQRHLGNLLEVESPQTLADEVGGLIRTGWFGEDLGGRNAPAAAAPMATGDDIAEEGPAATLAEDRVNLAQHIDTVLRNTKPEPGITALAAKAEDTALAEARATLCGHLLVLERADLLEKLVGEGVVSLQTILEQAVKSKRISLVEWILELHKEEINNGSTHVRACSESPGHCTTHHGPWNLRDALQSMQENDRHELLYGLMVRDWEKDRGYRKRDKRAYQGPDSSFTATAWQGRTTAISREASDESAQPASSAATQIAARDERGLLVDWLVRHGHIQHSDIFGLMRYRSNYRTVAFAVTHAHGQPSLEQGQYSIDCVSNALHLDEVTSLWHRSDRKKFLTDLVLTHPDVDVAVQLGHKVEKDTLSPSRLLVNAVRTRDVVRISKLMEHGHIDFDRDIETLSKELTSEEIAYLITTLKDEHVISMFAVMYKKQAPFAEKMFLAALREPNMAAARRFLDVGLVTRDLLVEMRARNSFTADDADHLLELYEGRNHLQIVRTLDATGSTGPLFQAALQARDIPSLQKLMDADPHYVDQVLELYRAQTLSSADMGYLFALKGHPLLALAAGVSGSVPRFFAQAVRGENQPLLHRLLDAGMDINAAISELRQNSQFRRHHFIILARLLGTARLDALSTAHLATLLRYALDRGAPPDLFDSIADTICKRLRPEPAVPPQRPQEPLDLIAVLNRARPSTQTLHRLLRALERHGQFDNATRDALLRFCSESTSESAVPLFKALRSYHFRSGHPILISTAQISAVLEHALGEDAPNGLLDAVGKAACARLQAGQQDNGIDLIAMLGRTRPRLDQLNRLLAILDQQGRLDAAMLEQWLTFIGESARRNDIAPYMALYDYRNGLHRQKLLSAMVLNRAMNDGELQA